MNFNRVEKTSYDEVKKLHRDSDVDENPLAQHHTLGALPNQASPGDHIHDGRSSRKLYLKDMVGVDFEYTVAGGTAGTQPTYSGDVFSGSYTTVGNLCFFQIDVDFSNVLTFGTGQYFVKLPFVSKHAMQFSDGCLHDFSLTRQYPISAHVYAGTDTLQLFTVDLQGNRVYDFPFEQGEPITLTTADNFHIAGTYQFQA